MTDPFTTAARAYAATNYAVDWDTPEYYDSEDRQEAENFMAGAAWARDHMNAHPLSDAEVEAVAQVAYEYERMVIDPEWPCGAPANSGRGSYVRRGDAWINLCETHREAPTR